MECTGSQIFNYENPFKNYENSHMIIQEILASINWEITERGKCYGVGEWRKLFHISFFTK